MKTPSVLDKIRKMSASDRKLLRRNAEGMLAAGRDVASAQLVLDELDNVEEQEKAADTAHILGLSLTERVIRSFRKEPMTDPERRAVQALLDHPGATTLELTKAAGWQDKYWNLQFGELCKKRRAHLGPAPEQHDSDGSDFYSSILAIYSQANSSFTMRQEAVEAFAVLGLRGKATP